MWYYALQDELISICMDHLLLLFKYKKELILIEQQIILSFN